MANNEVNELSTAVVTVAFTDETGAAVVPSAAQYAIHDLATGAEILGETDITALASSVDIEIDYDKNAILGAAGDETHILTVLFQYGTGKQGSAMYKFRVKDLAHLPFPAGE